MTALSVRESQSTVTEPIASAKVSAVQCLMAVIERRSGGASEGINACRAVGGY